MGETLYRRPEILFRWGRRCFDTESPGGDFISVKGRLCFGGRLYFVTPASKLLQRSIREMTVVWLYSAPVVPGYECFIGLYSVQQPTSQPYTKTHLIWLGS